MRELVKLRHILAAYSDEDTLTEPEIKAKNDAISNFNAQFFGVYFLDRPTTITFIREGEAPPSLEMHTIQARFAGIVPASNTTQQLIDRDVALYVDNCEQDTPAICVSNGNYYYTIPLDSSVLTFDIQAPPLRHDSSTPLGALKNIENTLQYFVSTPTFQAMDRAAQDAQLHALIGECLENPDITAVSQTPLIALTDQGTFQATSFKIMLVEGEESPFYIRFNLLDSENPVILHPSAIADLVLSIDREDIDEAANLMETIFSRGPIRKKINDIENAINDACDDVERQNLIERVDDDMCASMPELETYLSRSYEIHADIYSCENERQAVFDDYKSIDDAIAMCFDAICLDGTWRVAITFKVCDDETMKTHVIYIIPDDEHAIILRPTDDIQEYDNSFDMIQYFEEVTDECARLTQSNRFYRSRYETQKHQLQELSKDVEDKLSDKLQVCEGTPVYCVAEKYYPVLSSSVSISCADIATYAPVTLMELPENDRDSIRGHFRGVTIPEATINTQATKFRSVQDFPLSNGKPMVVIENEEIGVVYFVPLCSIKLLNNADIPEF